MVRHINQLHLGYGAMKLVHVLPEQTSETREDLLVPRVVLEGDLLLHFAIVNLHWTKRLHCVSGVDGLPRFPGFAT